VACTTPRPAKASTPNAPDVIAGWRRNELLFRKFITDRGFSWAKHVYWGNVKHPYGDHNPEWTLEAALEFIDENHDKPFYLHYCTTLMHGGSHGWNTSLDSPLSSGAGKLDELPKVIPSRRELCEQVDRAGFDEGTYGFTWMDATVGAMLDKLDQLGIADNTLFVFVSDHGTERQRHTGTKLLQSTLNLCPFVPLHLIYLCSSVPMCLCGYESIMQNKANLRRPIRAQTLL